MFGPTLLPRNLPASLRDARDPKIHVRLSALQDLGRHASGAAPREATRALEHALLEDDSDAVRAQAAVALADAEASGSTDALVRAIESDAHRRVRQMALMALGEVGRADDEAVKATVERALGDEGAEIRFQALIAWHRLVGKEAATALIDACDDGDVEVRHVALRLAEEQWLDSEGAENPPAALAEAAAKALGDSEWPVRLAAAILLSRSGDGGAQAVLCEALNLRKPAFDPEDEHSAIELAGELGLVQARPGLERRAWGFWSKDRFSWQARVALAKLGDARAKSTILRGLVAWTRDARTLAVVAAGRAGLSEAKSRLEAMRESPRDAEPEAVAEALRLLEG